MEAKIQFFTSINFWAQFSLHHHNQDCKQAEPNIWFLEFLATNIFNVVIIISTSFTLLLGVQVFKIALFVHIDVGGVIIQY